jgi:peptidoglycan hydrolase CwlO-like protein
VIFSKFTYRNDESILVIGTTKTKNMSTKNSNRSFIKSLRSTPVMVALSVAVLVLGFAISPLVRADNYQAQIQALNAANAANQNALGSLQNQASTYQGEIDQLQAQINSIQAALAANSAKQADIQAQIVANQAELVKQKSILANDIKTMYINGQLSPVEMLATSDNLSDYVDQQVSYSQVQQKIQSTVSQINDLQVQLKDQKTQIDALVQTESTQNQTLSSDQAQQNNLLSMNQTQQDQYTSSIKSNNAQISKLIAAQAAANASVARSVRISSTPSSGSGGWCDIGQGNGGYPSSWCSAQQDSIPTMPNSGSYGDNRECTSFAYWYFKNVEGHSDFNATGNAGWWYLTSNYSATTWSGGVQAGAVGIEPSSSLNAPVPSLHGGYYGHVMIVLALPGTTYDGHLPYTSAAAGTSVPDGYVLVMSMNEDSAGHFMYNLWPENYLMYINP